MSADAKIFTIQRSLFDLFIWSDIQEYDRKKRMKQYKFESQLKMNFVILLQFLFFFFFVDQ